MYWYDIGFKGVCKSGSVGRVHRYLRQIVLSLGIPASSSTVSFYFFIFSFVSFFNFNSLSFITLCFILFLFFSNSLTFYKYDQ